MRNIHQVFNNHRLLFIFSLFVFQSCFNYNYQENLIKYKDDLKSFPSFLVDFFPENVSNVYVTKKNVDTTNLCISYIYYDFEFIKEDTKLLKDSLEKINIIKYNSGGSNLITIKRSWVWDLDRSKKKKYQTVEINNTTYYPIPFFESITSHGPRIREEEISSPFTESGLSENFVIYVLDSKPGNYWQGLKPLDYMPEGWKNGYSKGICINEENNIIIYWFVVW